MFLRFNTKLFVEEMDQYVITNLKVLYTEAVFQRCFKTKLPPFVNNFVIHLKVLYCSFEYFVVHLTILTKSNNITTNIALTVKDF